MRTFRPSISPAGRLVCLAMIALAGGCTALRPGASAPVSFYSLDDANAAPGTGSHVRSESRSGLPTLILSPARAASGFDSARIIYVREDHKIEYFAHNEWVDTPARMLAPLLVAALEGTKAFRAVALAPSAAAGDLRLDTEVIRLEHEFLSAPSRVRFTLRAYLVEDRTRRVIARREFDATVSAKAETPYGGVVSANAAVKAVLAQLAAFCAEAAADWQQVGAKR